MSIISEKRKIDRLDISTKKKTRTITIKLKEDKSGGGN